jgi:hypothetical protein
MEGAALRLLFVPGDGGDTEDDGGPALRFGRASIVPNKTPEQEEGDHDP